MWGKRAKIDKADKIFSLYMRTKANWKCEYCHKDYSKNKRYLDVSHYWGRVHEGTRFEPDNIMVLCRYHHNYLGHGEGRGEYMELMKRRLGEYRFKSLELQARMYHKKDRAMAYLIFKKLYDELIA